MGFSGAGEHGGGWWGCGCALILEWAGSWCHFERDLASDAASGWGKRRSAWEAMCHQFVPSWEVMLAAGVSLSMPTTYLRQPRLPVWVHQWGL